jgi:hypothetical protein
MERKDEGMKELKNEIKRRKLTKIKRRRDK